MIKNKKKLQDQSVTVCKGGDYVKEKIIAC